MEGVLRQARLQIQSATHRRDRRKHGHKRGYLCHTTSQAKFKEFTRKEIADASKTTEVLTCLSADSRAKVDGIVDIALKSGATKAGEPMDHGFMYSRSFNDLDGHIWEYMSMNPPQSTRSRRSTSVSRGARVNAETLTPTLFRLLRAPRV